MSHYDLTSEIEKLNPEQKKATLMTEGRLLILAGAGSGKTRVLTLRMAHLIKNCQVSPKSILGLTFTNKAASEMKHRIGSFIDKNLSKQITLCTFHSFCMKILRADISHLGYTSSFTLWDEQDVKRMISILARDYLKCEKELPSLEPTINAINRLRSKGLKSHEIEETGSKWHDQFTSEIYRRLLQSMRAYNALDFDALLSTTVELFEKFPDVLKKYQEQYRYVMIDEYQDTNQIQYRLAELLTQKHHNLCVVGDDDQSIYGWRGADIKNILAFANANVIKLEQNYRSTNCILSGANGIISKNSERHEKKLWSQYGSGQKIEVFHAPNEIEEANAVVCRIVKLKEQHALKWRDIAILYRSNALSRQFELALMRHHWNQHGKWVQGIPYQIWGGTEFYGRKEIKDLSSYLRFLVNTKDQEALLRIINQPRRGIGEGALDLITAYNRRKNVPLWDVLKMVSKGELGSIELQGSLNRKAFDGVRNFVSVIQEATHKFQNEPLDTAMRWFVEEINYKNSIFEEVKSNQMRDFKCENVEEFIQSMSEYKTLSESENRKSSLTDFLNEITLHQDWNQLNSKNQEDDKVSLLTFHSSKGLEFPACFLVGIEDQIIPHEKSLLETGLEEERRLMYVAVTRAMKFLTISMAQERKRMGKTQKSSPSRFLMELPKETLNITHWDKF